MTTVTRRARVRFRPRLARRLRRPGASGAAKRGSAARSPTPWRVEKRLIPDEQPVIERTLIELADVAGCDLVLTTGGTGPAPRDVTPGGDARRRAPGDAGLRRADAPDLAALRAHRDPVAPGRGRPRPHADPQPARPAEVDPRDARRRAATPRAASLVPGIFAAVPYCLDLIGGPYLETHEAVCKAFRPKSAMRPPQGS